MMHFGSMKTDPNLPDDPDGYDPDRIVLGDTDYVFNEFVFENTGWSVSNSSGIVIDKNWWVS